ncbi:VOC family protein [Kribbella sp. NPDC056861]|uniref:VOC family protein n=1 Tax=Kribbella sp. NPDC056861 TaxID=3154857 RepID=UPI0034307035
MTAWYDTSSLTASAALAARIAELGGPLPDLELRAGGVRVGAELPELGLTADDTAVQSMQVQIDAVDQEAVRAFWQGAFGYDGLVDPLRRDPALSFGPQDPPRVLRNRIHVDVVRTAEAVEAFRAAEGLEPYGAYGLTLADAEGNEIDLVPGDELPEAPDWRLLFGAMTFYPTTSSKQAIELATAVAELADAAGWPLLIDLRPEGVAIDTGKDQWENDEEAFKALALQVQTAARELGLTADPTRVRLVQFAFDAVDIPAVQAFWLAVLGYQRDPREFLSDIYDPRRLNPVIMFQQLDADDPRRQQRDRVHLELLVPREQVQTRVATGLAAGGELLPDGLTLTDPEGNELGIRALDG